MRENVYITFLQRPTAGSRRSDQTVAAMSHPRFDASACANSLADLLASWQTYFKYSVHYLGSSLDNQPLTEEERFEHQAEVCGVLLSRVTRIVCSLIVT